MKGVPAKKKSGDIAFTYEGVDVLFDDARFISLTDMWRAAGSPANKSPKYFRETAVGTEFVESMAKNLNSGISAIWKSRRGKYLGGVFAHWQVALAYGKYLSPEFHRFVNAAFKEWSEEKVDPSLKMDRAIEGYEDKGFSLEWIEKRCKGKVKRKELGGVIKDHNGMPTAKVNPYSAVTNSIYLKGLGGTAKEIRVAKGLGPNAVLRDHMEGFELDVVTFGESLAIRAIKMDKADGNEQIIESGKRAAEAVGLALSHLNAG